MEVGDNIMLVSKPSPRLITRDFELKLSCILLSILLLEALFDIEGGAYVMLCWKEEVSMMLEN
jgi:hypothetical protein